MCWQLVGGGGGGGMGNVHKVTREFCVEGSTDLPSKKEK